MTSVEMMHNRRRARTQLLVAVGVALLAIGCETRPEQPEGAALVVSSAYPNRLVTPGEVFAEIAARDVCVPGYSRRMRFVPVAEMRAVDREYGIRYVRGANEIDHLIPLELGGDNAIANLWPQPRAGTWNAERKDELENALHDRVCAGDLRLEDAQRAIATDWVAAYRRYVSP